ncbi:MAG: hypothetical protein GEV03_05135 [Streptosporangiales bacterium]|nr:hypothetical protein [Streptosporangiales bacterium]
MRDTISWPPRGTSRRGVGFWGIVLLTVLITVATFSTAAFGSGVSPGPPSVVPASPTGKAEAVAVGATGRGMLDGAPQSVGTGLRLMVAADLPVLLDVDSGRTTPIVGLPHGDGQLHHVLRVGNNSVIISSRTCDGCRPTGRAFVLQGRTAVPLGSAWSVAPSLDGQGVWMLAHAGDDRCTLSEMGLDGVLRHPARPIDCRAQLRKETPAGILVDLPADGYQPPDSALLDPETGEAVGRYPPIEAMTEHVTLTESGAGSEPPVAGEYGRFALMDLLSGTRDLLPWPSRLAWTGEAAEDPTGRFLAVEFVDPSHGPGQLMDVWVLDTEARRWLQLPQMPTYTDLKRTSMAWTTDGRLVMLGTFDGLGDAVVTWGAGEGHLSYSRVDLPDARGDASLVVLPTREASAAAR